MVSIILVICCATLQELEIEKGKYRELMKKYQSGSQETEEKVYIYSRILILRTSLGPSKNKVMRFFFIEFEHPNIEVVAL